MAAPSWRNFGGRKPHPKNRKSGSKPQDTSRKSYKGKCDKGSCQKKQKNYSAASPTGSNNAHIERPVIPSLPVPVEESMWEAKIDKTRALHTQWKLEDMTLLGGEELVACQRQPCIIWMWGQLFLYLIYEKLKWMLFIHHSMSEEISVFLPKLVLAKVWYFSCCHLFLIPPASLLFSCRFFIDFSTWKNPPPPPHTIITSYLA